MRAVIAKSFERIHRSNLIGLGILPLVFEPGQGVEALNLVGSETIEISDLDAAVREAVAAQAKARHPDDRVTDFLVRVDLRSAAEATLIHRNGMFQAALAALELNGPNVVQ